MPNWKSAIAQRLPNLNLDSDVIEELSQHLDDRYQELLSENHSHADAECIALAELDHNDLLAKQFPAPRTSLLTDLARDLRFGFRTLRKQRLFTVIAVLTLSLGIGATTAVFSVVNGVLLRPLPFPEPDRLVWVWDTQPQLPTAPASLPDFIDWHDQNRSFESLAAFQSGNMFLDTGEGSRDTPVGLVTPDFFSVFHTQPILGRTFTNEETQPGKFRVVVLSHALWQNDFGSDPNIVGRTIQGSGFPYTIIGVMPAGFSYPDRALFWRPLPIDPAQLNRGPHYLRIVGRLRAGVSLSEAQAEMSTIATRLAQQYPEKIAGHNVKLELLRNVVVGDIASTLIILLGAVGFVLLIACANVANLLLAKVGNRQREIAVRAALGASRFRIVRQLLVESVLLAIGGGVVGLAVAIAGVKWLISLGPDTIPRLQEISVDPRIAIFALLVSVATGLLFGVAPALQISRTNLTDVLKESGRSAGGVQRTRLRKTLIVSEVALSLILVTGAGLLIRSFTKLNRVEPGFNSSRVLTMGIALFRNKYPENPQVASFYSQLLEKAAQTPGVTAVAAIAGLPLTGASTTNSFTIIGRPPIRKEDEPTVEYGVVTPKYFEVMGIPLFMGRDITNQDTRQSPNVGVINELFAKRFFGDANPIGQQIHLQGQERDPINIIGVVGDVRQYGLDEQAIPEVYVPFLQDPLSTNYQRAMMLVAKTETEPGAVAASLRDQVTSLDRSLPIYALKPMNEYLYDSLARRRFNLTLLSVFGVVALLLAAVGIYGVISYSVSQRTQEIGIRLALGAKTRDVLLMVVRQGMVLAIAGILLGMIGAFVLTRLMKVLLFEVSPTDPVTFIATGSLLILVALLACLIPARRATRVDPLIALRYE
ncbi:MAG TPA: ABC transporter permease [Pyrinomonadaceae bacterium]